MFSGSIPALVTPFKDGGERVDFEGFQNLLQFHLDGGSDGVVIAGTTGEGATLEVFEWEKLICIAVEMCKGRIPVIANTGSNATKKSVDATRRAKVLGANGCLATVPYYNKPSFEGIALHFERISDVGLPTIVYHHPGRTGISLNADQLIQVGGLEGIVGVKDSSGDISLVKEILSKEPKLSILSGDDESLIPCLQAGATGTISVMANVIPGFWKEMVSAALQGNDEVAQEMFEEVQGLIWATFLEVNPQGIKYAVSLQKGIENSLRLPLLTVKEKTAVKIRSALYALSACGALSSLAKKTR